MTDMPSMLPPLTWEAFANTWGWRPVWDAVIVLLLAGYVWGLVTARRRGEPGAHPARVVSFVTGLAVLFVTLNSAVDVYAMALFWDHMVEHLLLIMVVPALLVAGHPITVLRAALAGPGRARLDAFLHTRPVKVLTHPLTTVAIYSAVIVGTHLTSFMDVMATHMWVMTAEQVLYLVSGYLFLLPLIGAEPIAWNLPHLFRVALLLFAMTPDTVVGIVLLQSNQNLFPLMHAAHPDWAPSAVRDQQIGGALMWAAGDGIMMFLAVAVVVALIANPRRGAVIGTWLEGVRRRELAAHVAQGDPREAGFDDDADVDDDDAVLEAYNRMLQRLNRHPD